MTEVGDRTAEGAVLGTVHYMSPEQVQGKSVDHRSDVFSFGCMLYEAATRRRPFTAESNVETMHKILHDKPQPIEEINPAAPSELRRLVRRCLNKAPDQRLQSMKDLAIELREIVDEYDSLSASATSATVGSGGVQPVTGRKKKVSPLLVGALAVAAAGIGYGIWSSFKTREPDVQPFQNMRATTQTSRGDVTGGSLSQDGRYLAYVAGTAGRSTLRVRQVATGSDVEILPEQDATFESPSFTPDGNYLFFLKRSREQPNYRSLMRVPSLGGPEEERGFDVDSRVTFSPDGTRVCFLRGGP
jgi:serine/threonine protein kinase